MLDGGGFLMAKLGKPALLAAFVSLFWGGPTLVSEAKAAPLCKTHRYTQAYETLSICASSYLRSSKAVDFTVRSMLDTSGNRAWCEGARGNGIGETIQLTLEQAAPVKGFWFHNGDIRTSDHYGRNGRIQTVRIQGVPYSDPTVPNTSKEFDITVTLADTARRQYVPLPEMMDPRWIQIEIQSVYSGTQFQDVCLHGFGVDFGF
jgi:hypothetical protein